ncbi:MAG: hypothetical protein DRJ40_07625 [Thermoprotei archaeon]|nr:MAG: hypothetical protein DRJ40_07625 [Thermoprotei archaeon]
MSNVYLLIYRLPNPQYVRKLDESSRRELEVINLRVERLVRSLGIECSDGAILSLESEDRIREVMSQVKTMYINFMEKYEVAVDFVYAVLALDEEDLKQLKPVVTYSLQLRTQKLIERIRRLIERVKSLNPKQRRRFRNTYREIEREYQTHVLLHYRLGIKYSELSTLHEEMNVLRGLFAGI